MTNKASKLSVVVPCFNEQDNIQALCDRVDVALSSIKGGFDLLLIDDGSSDETWSRISELAKKHTHIEGVQLSRNFGHQAALSAGLHNAKGDYIAILDADLQDPPELLPEMLTYLEEQQADVVYGKRKTRDGETAFKKQSASMFYRLLNGLSDVDIPRDTGDFRIMTRQVLDSLNNMPEAHRFIRGMVSWLGFKQVAFEYERAARHEGKSGYSIRRMIRLALDGITGFSIRPLRLTFYLGLILAALSSMLLFYTLISWINGNAVQGWTSMMGVILLLQGMQFIILGIIGEYLGRVFTQSKSRPLYIVKSTTND